MQPQDQQPQQNQPNQPPLDSAPQTPQIPAIPTAPPPPSPSFFTKKLVVVVVIVVLIGVLASAFFLMKSDNKLSTDSSTPADSTQVNEQGTKPTQAAPANIPSGWVTKTRKCFSIALPPDNDLAEEDNSCLIFTAYGKDAVASINTFPFDKPDGTLAENVAKWKADNSSYKIVSDEAVKIGGLDAQKIVYSISSVTGDTQYIATFVYTGQKYKIEGYSFNGFQIIGMYDNKYESKTTIDQVLNSWTWL